MPSSLALDTARTSDGALVLSAVGEIDQSNVDTFDEALTAAAAETAARNEPLTVDLSAVEYLDSAAINVLFPHADHLRVIAHRFLVRVFDVTGLSELAAVEPAPDTVET